MKHGWEGLSDPDVTLHKDFYLRLVNSVSREIAPFFFFKLKAIAISLIFDVLARCVLARAAVALPSVLAEA